MRGDFRQTCLLYVVHDRLQKEGERDGSKINVHEDIPYLVLAFVVVLSIN